MIIVPGRAGKDLCDPQLVVTRRDILRVGGSGLLGLGLGSMLELQATSARGAEVSRGPGWGKAKSIIMVYLQGGPSHLDLWDPKENVPDNVKSAFKPIATKVPGIQVMEVLPRLAQITDKFTFIRSMSYTPNGLFNHTAAIYQMLTGYAPDKVSPSGQLEPPSPADFPTAGSQVSKLKPPSDPVLPFVELPRPLQESGIIGKGGSAGFLGKAYDPYRMYQDPAKPAKLEDLAMHKDVPPERLKDRFELLKGMNDSMPDLEKALKSYAIDE